MDFADNIDFDYYLPFEDKMCAILIVKYNKNK